MSAIEVDVVQISDLRLPGGTSSSVAEEIRAQSAAGLRTALVHAPSTVTSRPLPWSRPIQRILDLPGVQVVSPRAELRARVVVLRHPTVAASTPWTFERMSAEHVVVVANHSAVDAAGIHHYDVEATDARVREMFDVDPVWAPIGPVVRRSIRQQTTRVPLREQDWVNIFDLPPGTTTRTGFVGEIPVIGRHSRPQPGKWPATGEDILAAYPDSEDYQVEILGGAEVAERILDGIPPRWHVLPFGGEEPATFLGRVDFWVYFHHPDLREAFGRAAMEALAAGAVAILPEYLRELFGDAALYGQPQDVRRIVDELYADPGRFLAQSAAGQDFARRFGPQLHLERLAELGVTARREDARPEPPFEPSTETGSGPAVTTLFVADAEDGDSALAALCQASAGAARPVLAVIATRPPTQRSAGAGPLEYIASQRALQAPDEAWQDYLTQRLVRLVDRLDIERIVVVGGEVPAGVVNVLAERAVDAVWQTAGREQHVPRPI